MTATRRGKIVTFYSYKGGTGRSMALANIGWILASTGRRVLLIDWDLEAPGLHRYLHPFLQDKELASTPGLINFFVDVAAAARMERAKTEARWFEDHASLVPYTVPVDWEFPQSGLLEFVGAGRQDAGYAVAVTTYNWQAFYDEMGGGVFLEVLKERLRRDYDFVLIDSRTGISDTSGICTVQMPDELVVLFTLNRQSIRGASSIAATADALRRKKNGEPGLRIWPVPTRVELSSEKERLDAAREEARETFQWYVGHIPRSERGFYWDDVEVMHQPYYSFEEVLATFADRPRQKNTMLARMEAIASRITGEATAMPRIPEDARIAWRNRFERENKAEAAKASSQEAYAYVSYNHEDRDVVDQIVERFQAHGVRLWIDSANLRAGDRWLDALGSALEASVAVIVFIGPRAPRDTQFMEWHAAFKKNKPIIPVLINGASSEFLPPELRHYYAASIPGKGKRIPVAAIDRLAADVNHAIQRIATSTATLDPADPQKGRWGGQSTNNSRRLSATVDPISSDFFRITLTVDSTSANEPLTGDVTFHLHPVFSPQERNVPVVNGRAELQLLGWGAFTVGAVADHGITRLEIDLAEDTRFPKVFRER